MHPQKGALVSRKSGDSSRTSGSARFPHAAAEPECPGGSGCKQRSYFHLGWGSWSIRGHSILYDLNTSRKKRQLSPGNTTWKNLSHLRKVLQYLLVSWEEFYNRRCWAILWMTGDHSPLCSDKLMSNLRCSSVYMKTLFPFFFFFPLVLFCCQTARWESRFICPTAPIPGELSVYQVSSNSSLRTTHSWERAGERCTSPAAPGVKPSTCSSGGSPLSCVTTQGALLCPLLPSSGHHRTSLELLHLALRKDVIAGGPPGLGKEAEEAA